ncbi:probable DNA double-strand break repair Rad50 ATPase isoform X2 [Dysidea avara]|uniref:probable DNA double-strand break repair Rad50 ATPase isoform X2 n=1 Tax=Dysidea avara TaxID=196820 RepID=UPI00331BF0DD
MTEFRLDEEFAPCYSVQINTLKRLVEDCTEKVKDREVKLQQLLAKKNDCATLEEETLRPQELDESTKELEECEKRLKSMDESLVTAQKGSEGLVKRLMMLEKAMKEQNYGSNSELSSIQSEQAQVKEQEKQGLYNSLQDTYKKDRDVERLSNELAELKVRKRQY